MFLCLNACLSPPDLEAISGQPQLGGPVPPALSHPKICQAGQSVLCSSLAGIWSKS